jgi:hypothetical protein
MQKRFGQGLALALLLASLASPAQADLFRHIKTFCMGSGMNTAEGKTWMQNHMDMDAAGTKLSALSTKYVSWSDNQSDFLPISQQYLPSGKDFNPAFLHYSQDTSLPKHSGDPMTLGAQRDVAMKEDRFSAVLVTDGLAWTTGADAHAGSALKFSGNQTVSLLKDSSPALGNTFTLEAWVKPNTQTSTCIAGWGTNNGLWIDAWGNLAAEVNVDKARQGCSQRYVFPAWNTWYHIVGVGDAANGQTLLYVNGVQIGATHTFTPGAVTNRTGFFTLGNPAGTNYSGCLDGVRLYNRALTAAEVSQRYASDTLITSGLVLRWDFDEGSGTAVADTSGNGNAGSYHLTNQAGTAYGDAAATNTPANYDLALGAQLGDMLYLGLPWKFSEINFNLGRAAGAGWQGAWEYWNGSAWTALGITDGTLLLQQSGKVAFAPPADWSHTAAAGWDLFWVRLRCTQAGSVSPAARAAVQYSRTYEWRGVPGVAQQKYASSGDGNSWIVPGWDPANDPNHDGYVDDAEFASLKNNSATARFEYRAKVPAWYFSNRWVMNLADPDFLAYAGNTSHAALVATGCDGIYVDNVSNTLPDATNGKSAYREYPDPAAYSADVIHFLHTLRQYLPGATLLINGGWSTPGIIDEVDGALHESCFYYRNSPSDTQANIDLFNGQVALFTARNKKFMLGADPAAGLTNSPNLARTRVNLYCLARYYLSAAPNTYLMYSDDSAYATPSQDWFEAMACDVGSPVGNYYVYASDQAGYPSPPPANAVPNPSFESNNDGDPSLPDGWAKGNWTGSVAAALSPVHHSGAFSLMLTSTGNNTGGAYQHLVLKPSTTYTLSAWIKTSQLQAASASASIVARIVLYPGPGGATGTPSAGVGSGTQDWILVSSVFTTGADTTGAYIYGGQIYGASGTAWFDDLRVEEGNFPLRTVFAREYENALVLLRPIDTASQAIDNYGDATGTTLALNAPYRLLASDGTLGPASTSVTLRNYEGAVLIKQSPGTSVPGLNTGSRAWVYPNPASQAVNFLPPASWPEIDTTLYIQNISGRLVSKLTIKNVSNKPITWDARATAPGIYVYRIVQNNKVLQTGKIALKR